jgi:SAM-dependent methyltransferase
LNALHSMNRVRLLLTACALRRHGKDAFVRSLPREARVFDVGCGNASPARVKALRPDVHYVGLDIGDYNQPKASKEHADEYIVTSPQSFAESVRLHPGVVDAFISAHNLEHCDDSRDVLNAMAGKLRRGGTIYLAYPCPESIRFPSRRGTLNFFDDPSHSAVVNTQMVLEELAVHRIDVSFINRRYRPALPAAIGLVLEPVSAALRRNIPLAATWALYGFETVIWGRKA